MIGCESACVLAALGIQVTVVEGRDALIAFLADDMSAALRTALQAGGNHVLLGEDVSAAARRSRGVHFATGRTLDIDKVMYSAWRSGNTATLGVEADRRGLIVVDRHGRATAPTVYAAGDVSGHPHSPRSRWNTAESRVQAFGFPYKLAVSALNPFGVYTIAEISKAGATEKELENAGVPYEIDQARYDANAPGQIIGDGDGLLTLLFEVPSNACSASTSSANGR